MFGPEHQNLRTLEYLFLPLWCGAGFFLLIAYAAVIHYFQRQWRQLPVWKLPSEWSPQTHVSVLIPARDEAAGIGDCLASVLGQNYPRHLLEILVIDDFSTDATADRVRAWSDDRLRLIQPLSPGGGKKQALTTGVSQARGELVVTIDADCLAGPGWLARLVSFYEAHRPVLIAGPVLFHREGSLLQRFQSLDFLGMMLLTGAGIRSGRLQLANGANLAFVRKAFEAVGGYTGNAHLASGDDVFLLQKMTAAFPGRAAFLRCYEGAVRTEAPADWRAFVRQRLRWGAKNKRSAGQTRAVLALVFLLCWYILFSGLGTLIAGWPAALFTAGLVLAKSAVDYGMLREATRFFHRTDLLRSFWPSQALHIGYIAVIGLLANLARQYKWKGRWVK